MRFSSLLAPLLLFSALLRSAPADTLVLTNGTEHEGELVSETEDEVRFRIQESATVRRLRTFPRSEVRRIERTTEDQKQINGVLALVPAPELLDALGYDQRIGRAEAFLEAFPEAEGAARVEQVLEQLREGRRRVGDGERFLDGRWLNRVQLENRQAEIEGIKRLGQLQQGIERRQWAAVMAAWDELDQFYRGTRGFAEARALALGSDGRESFLEGYRSALGSRLGELRREMERSGVQEPVGQETRRRFDQIRGEERRSGRKWLTINEEDPKHLEETILQVDKELERLGAEDAARLEALREAMEAVYAAFDRAEIEGLEAGLRSLGGNGASKQVVEMLQQRLEAVEKAGPGAAASAIPAAADPVPAEEPAGELEDEPTPPAEPEDATEPAAASGDEPGAATEAGEPASPEETATVEPEEEETASEAAASESARPAVRAARSGFPLIPVIGGVVGLLVVLVVILLVAQKRQSKGGDAGPQQ